MRAFFSAKLAIMTIALLGGTAGLSGCGVMMAAPATVASLAVWGTTGKSPTDHAVSGATGQDCSLFRALDSRKVCNSATAKRAEVVNLNNQVTNAPVLR